MLNNWLKACMRGFSTLHSVVTSTSSQGILEANNRRISITFCPPSSGTVTYSPDSVATIPVGITLTSTSRPYTLNLIDGNLSVRRAWSVIASAGTPTAAVIADYVNET